MPAIPQPPATVQECLIYRQLLSCSIPEDGLVSKVDRLAKTATPLLDLIVAGPFKEFTLHNRDHAKKVLHLMGYLAGAECVS